MTPREEIRNRAFMMGIATGDMPNVDLIWSLQEQDGFNACFGEGRHCKTKECRYRKHCLALDFYAERTLPIAPNVSAGQNTPARSPVRVIPFASRRPAAQNLRRRALEARNETESAPAGVVPE